MTKSYMKKLNITNPEENANQNFSELSPWRQERASVGEGVEKGDPHALLVGM